MANVGSDIQSRLSRMVVKDKIKGIPVTTSGIPITPTTLKLENMINRQRLKSTVRDAEAPEYGNTLLLGDEYFEPLRHEREYPYVQGGPTDYVSGFAPHTAEIFSSFGRGDKLAKKLQDAIVLNADSEAAQSGILPSIYRHELAHTVTPNFRDNEIIKKVSNLLPDDWKEFLLRYPPQYRDEELKAEVLGGRKMPGKENVLTLIKKLIKDKISYN